jgi:asparagine synthase (glutamine-hydrolysing)
MCGIVGYFNPQKPQEDLQGLYTATSLIAHRGPDDEGYAAFNLQTAQRRQYVGPDSPDILKAQFPSISDRPVFPHHLAFGFRRFSIVDLSEKGHQPFWSQDKSVCLIFNGEVYNYVEIRNELEQLGYSFLTTCDTEVLLVGYQVWGMEVLTRCNGPIALVLYDSRQKKIFMARDRIGKSPLYYAIHQGTLYWASEIKAILSMTGQSAFGISEQVVYDYLNFGWRDLDNTTFWEGIRTLDAASWASLDVTEPPTQERLNASLHRYWDFPCERLAPKDIPFKQAVAHFRELFTDAVRIRARADAKVAFSLSGGLDSSSIVAVAASTLPQQFRTYSIKYPSHEIDEEPLARLVYDRYSDKIDYQIHIPKNDDFWEVASDFIWLQEEPFHYPNAELFQAYLRQARSENYKVMIIGAGGDELLAGYQHNFWPFLMHLYQKKQRFTLAANVLLKTDMWEKYGFKKRGKLLCSLLCGDGRDATANIPMSFFNASGHQRAMNYIRDPLLASRVLNRTNYPASFDEMMVGYMSNWLMNYWLRNSNKSHFGVPVESRSPFLDYRLIDFVFSLPPEYLICRGWSKFLLRKTMADRLPSRVIWNRTKKGFLFNTQTWFLHSKPIISRYLKKVADNPYLDVEKLLQNYDNLIVQDPLTLWRCINLGLWWHRVIERSPIT